MAGSSSNAGSAAMPKAQELGNKVMSFLSTANGETIGACVVGLGAVTYLVLGRVGLVLIGAVGGAVWHASWEDHQHSASSSTAGETKRRKESSLDVVQRVLSLQHKKLLAKSEQEDDDLKAGSEIALAAGKELNFSEFPPETRAALTALTDTVIRDYVKWWYSPVLPQEVLFPYACRQTLVSFLLSVSRHLSRKRPADAFLNFLTNATSIFIVFLSELSHALMAPGMYDRDVGEAIKIYLDENPDSSLANLLNREQQEKKFRLIAEDVLQTFLDSKTYNCEPARTFLEHILAELILESVLKTSSQAFWINDWIIYLLEEGEPELMNAIDAGVGGATGVETKSSPNVAKKESSGHARRTSQAEKAMEDAMDEVRRLNEMIAAEEAQKNRDAEARNKESMEKEAKEDTISTVSTEQIVTPTSSQSERHSDEHEVDRRESGLPSSEKPNGDQAPKPTPVASRGFTSFDQILPPQQDYSDSSDGPPPLTLHKAKITLFDDEKPGEKGTIRSKPTLEYLLQIEPISSYHSGWMSARTYADFEKLHEFTSRVAKISGITAFSSQHAAAPSWKGKTKAALRSDLETYLEDALSHEGLAESEGMKRFLEKEKALNRPEPAKGVLGNTSETFQTVGKGVLDVTTAASKGVAGGGQAIFKGVSGVFTGPKRTSSNPTQPRGPSRTNSSTDSPVDMSSSAGAGSFSGPKQSQDISRNSPAPSSDSLGPPPLPTRPSSGSNQSVDSVSEDITQVSSLEHPSLSARPPSLDRIPAPNGEPSSTTDADLPLNLPPPPSEMSDDFSVAATASSETSHARQDTPATELATPSGPSLTPVSPPKIRQADDIDPVSAPELSPPPKAKASGAQASAPLDEQETMVAIELLFAVINELYTLSSAWQIRRTLLNTAKSFLLRPGNASLASIRVLLQESVLDTQLSDAGIAYQLRQMRANAMPTEEELAAWPEWPPNPATQADMHDKARRLLVTNGLPPALTSVMGAAASQEALARVFDALQVEEVARGLMFALILQGARAVTH